MLDFKILILKNGMNYALWGKSSSVVRQILESDEVGSMLRQVQLKER